MNNLVYIILMLILSAFFSGMEIAFITANRLRIELDKKQKHFASFFISIFEKNQGIYLATLLLGNIVALVVFSIVITQMLQPVLLSIISKLPLVLIIIAIISALIMLFAVEFLPKIIFRTEPNSTLKIFALPVMVVFIAFFPITAPLNFFSKWVINRFKRPTLNNVDVKRVFGKTDLVHLLNQSNEEDKHEDSNENDLKLFQNALEFSSVKVRDCMIPRPEIIAIEIDSSINELKKKFIESDFSKILVYKESIDNIMGYITSKSLFKNIHNIDEKIVEVSFVPETMPASRLLEKFIQEKKSMAVVVDEFGGVAGMLTIEDLIEEIFGEIEDEHDTSELIEKQIDELEYVFSGRLEIDYLNEKYDLKLPESEDYETLAGFIFNQYENIPKANAVILIGQYEFKIIKVSKTKIELIRLKLLDNKGV